MMSDNRDNETNISPSTQTPAPIAIWRIVGQAMWAAWWFYAAWWLFNADMSPLAKWLFIVFGVLYGLFGGMKVCKAVQRRRAVLARKHHPHTTPKFSITFSASPTPGVVVYMILSLLCFYLVIKFWFSSDRFEEFLAWLPVALGMFSVFAYFSNIFLSARKCVYRVETDTFSLYQRSKHSLSWILEAAYPLSDFVGIQRESTKDGDENIWLIGERQNVLIGQAHALRAGSYMRDAVADIYAATGLPVLATKKYA